MSPWQPAASSTPDVIALSMAPSQNRSPRMTVVDDSQDVSEWCAVDAVGVPVAVETVPTPANRGSAGHSREKGP